MPTSATWDQSQWDGAKNWLNSQDLSTDAGKQATFAKAKEMGFGADETASIVNRATGGTYTGSGVNDYTQKAGWGSLDSNNVIDNLSSKIAAGYNSKDNFTSAYDYAKQKGLGAGTIAQIINKNIAPSRTNYEGVDRWTKSQGLDNLRADDNWATEKAFSSGSRSMSGQHRDALLTGKFADQIAGEWGFDEGTKDPARRGEALNRYLKSQGMEALPVRGSLGQITRDPVTGMPVQPIEPTQAAAQWNVAPNQTVANQLETILKSGSPLMQQAKTRAMQQMQARGGLNTTMAATAGESAFYDAAMPIATADARTYGDAERFNTSEANAYGRDANQFAREQAMASFNLASNDWAAGQSQARALSLRAADNSFNLDRDALQNQYQSLRDSTQNTYQAGRDSALGLQTTQRDIAQAQATAQRDAALGVFDQQRAATTASTAETAQRERGYMNSINQARNDYASALTNISGSAQMDSSIKKETLTNLATTYNTMIENYSKLLGWDPSSWRIVNTDVATPA